MVPKITSPRQYNELSDEEYFDVLSEVSGSFRMWETTYFHEMPSYQSILEWYKGTGLRPYLEQLSDDDKGLFEEDILAEIIKYILYRKTEISFFAFQDYFTAFKTR